MYVNRSGYYKWLNRQSNPSIREINRRNACDLFLEYHTKFPSHGYRWLNAKIKLDLGIIYSDNYAHKICKFLNIKSISKHFKRCGKKQNREIKDFPNYILAELNPNKPFQIVVSDMTAFWAGRFYYELTLFMDLFNNEHIAYSLSNKRGDPSTYHNALHDVLTKKEDIKTLSLSYILTKAPYIPQRNSMNLFLYIISYIQCQSQVLLLKMELWKQLTVGLKKNYS